MNIYLKWKLGDIFVKSHLSLFDLEISQEENEFAKATLIVDALATLPPLGTEGCLEKEDGTLLFKGHFREKNTPIKSYFSTLELIAMPYDFEQQMRKIQKVNRVHPYWNELWVNPEKHEDYKEIQSVKTESLYCDPITHKLSWSDWFKGRQTLNCDKNFFQDSLSLTTLSSPLKSCTVHVAAHWIQSESGVCPLGGAIRRSFPHFKMSTFTEKSLTTKWPQKGHRMGKSGIWVIKSELKPIHPIGKIYKRYSQEIILHNPEKTYRATRYWFKPSLWVGWGYQQKRTESLTLTLDHNVVSQGFSPQDHKILTYTLQNINPDPKAYPWQPDTYYAEGSKIIYENSIYRCRKTHTSALVFTENHELWTFKKHFYTPLGHPARDSFFLTDQGYKAAEHAMERAKVELAKSCRCFKISFEGPWDYLETVSTDSSLRLSDPRLPEETLTGKVVSYHLIARGETGERIVKVTLLTHFKTQPLDELNVSPLPSYVLSDYCEDSYQVYEKVCSRTPSGIQYFRYDDQPPPRLIQRAPLLRGIELMNGPLEQEEKILSQSFETSGAIEKMLGQQATRIRLFFKDLRTKERLDHRITVQMAAPWSPPQYPSF